MSAEERVSYRDKLADALTDAVMPVVEAEWECRKARLMKLASIYEAALFDRAEQAEAATERARSDLLAMAERCILQAGHARQRGDAQREREWVVVAENARKILAALGQPPAEKEEDPNPDDPACSQVLPGLGDHDPATLRPR